MSDDEADYNIDSADAGASDTIPMEAGQIKKGGEYLNKIGSSPYPSYDRLRDSIGATQIIVTDKQWKKTLYELRWRKSKNYFRQRYDQVLHNTMIDNQK